MAKIYHAIGKFPFLLIGVLIITACTRIVAMSEDNRDCGDLFEAIFLNENVSMYIHPEIESRIPIQLVTQGFCEAGLQGSAYGSQIQFNPENVKDTAFFITNFVKTENKISFELKYEIEGIKITGNATYSSSSWAISELLVVES